MKQVTLVALYGQKCKPLEGLIKKCWSLIAESKFRRFFVPYHMSQIHGTIIGMERLIGMDDLLNANMWQNTKERKAMAFGHLLEVISDFFPMSIRFGGFEKDDDRFQSFGKTPYERSFEIQWSTSEVTLIG